MARQYNLPDFNLLCDAWLPPTSPQNDPPSLVEIPCQLYFHSKADIDQAPQSNEAWYPPLYLRIPTGVYSPVGGDIIQIRGAFDPYLLVRWWTMTHCGFPNQYISALVVYCQANGAAPLPWVPRP